MAKGILDVGREQKAVKALLNITFRENYSFNWLNNIYESSQAKPRKTEMLKFSLFSPITDTSPKAGKHSEQGKATEKLAYKTIGKEIQS